MSLKLWSFFLLAAALLPFVAANTQYIALENCALDTSAYACSASITATCNVTNTWYDNNNPTTVTDVAFTINEYTLAASRISGTVNNGTWIITTPNDQRFSDRTITLTKVSARASNGFTCSATSDRQFDGCKVAFDAPTAAANSCVCQQVRSTGPTTTSNSRTVTITPSLGCIDQTTTTYVEFADYCDPQWASQQTACTPTTSITDNPFLGTTTKTYTAANPSCCALTSEDAGYTWFNHNTGSDCLPPIDHNTVSTCSIEPVVQGGLDVSNNANLEGTSSKISSFSTRTKGLDTNQFQALAYDFNGDGSQEIVTIQPGIGVSYVQLYNNKMEILDSDSGIPIINQTTGQPAIGGVTKYPSNEYTIGNTVRVLVPAKSLTGTPKSNVYVFTATGSSLSQSDIISVDDDEGAGGILCVENICYFAGLGATGTSYSYNLGTEVVFEYLPVNGLYLGTTYLGALVDGAQYFNMRATNLKPVYVAEEVPGQSEYIVYLSTVHTNGTYDRTRGYAMITVGGDIVGVHALVEQAVLANTQLTLSDPVVIGRKMYIPYQETYSGNMELGVYVVDLLDQETEYILSPERYSIKVPYWSGRYSDSNEGISNAVANGLIGYVQVFTRTPSNSLGDVIEGTIPINSISRSSNVDSASILSSNNPSIGVYVHSSGDYSMFMQMPQPSSFATCEFHGYSLLNGGTSVSASSSCGSASSGTKTFIIDSEQDRMCLIYSPTAGTGLFKCASVSDPNSPTYPINFALTTTYGVPTVRSNRFTLNGVSSGTWLGVYQLFNVRGSTFQRIELINATGTPVFGSYGTPSPSLVAYDSGSDVLLTGWMYTNKYNDIIQFAGAGSLVNVSNTDVNYTAEALPISVAHSAFNWDWSDPRYIGTDGKKYKIQSFAPLAYTVTTQSCNGQLVNGLPKTFVPLYYNSDDHVLGYMYSSDQQVLPSATSGSYGTVIVENPIELGYCDFSSESAPILVSYGIKLPMYLSAVIGSGTATITIGSSNIRLPAVSVYERNAEGKGTGMDLVFMSANREADTVSCTDSGTVWTCGTRSETFEDICGAYTAGTRNMECTSVWSFDETHSASVNSTGSSTQTITFDSAGTSVSVYSAPFIKKSFIGLGDATGDGRQDIVNSYGITDFQKLTTTNYFPNSNANQHVAPLDINGDGALDVIITGTGIGTVLYTGIPTAQSTMVGDLNVLNFRCTQVPGTQNVNFQVAASAPSPDALVVSIDPGDGRGYITQSPTRIDGTYVLPYFKAGAFTPKVKVYLNSAPFNVKTSSCSINVAEEIALTATDCTIGTDGEFDYTDPINRFNWLVSAPSGATTGIAPSSGKLLMPSRYSATYELNKCGYETVSVEARLIPTNDANVFEVKGTGSGSAAMVIRRASQGPSGIYDETGNKISDFTWDASYSTYVTLQIVIQRATGQITYYVDGTQVFSKTKAFDPTMVKIADGGLFDYVRSSASGMKIGSEVINPDLQQLRGTNTAALVGCNASAMQAEEDIESRRSYPNVGLYCQSVSGSDTVDGKCDIIELSMIAGRYTECAKETYNYCVYETMAYESGSSGSGVAGGTACSALLVGAVGIGQVAVPLGKVALNLVVSNLTWVIVIVILVGFFLVAGALGRRK